VLPGHKAKGSNILITDQFNNRVIEIDSAGDIVWQFGHGPADIAANAIVGTNDAERVGTLTLMAGTGIPAGVTKFCRSGCPDNRVLLVDRAGNIVWQYGRPVSPGPVSISSIRQCRTPICRNQTGTTTC
jgi:hypothetical protein